MNEVFLSGIIETMPKQVSHVNETPHVRLLLRVSHRRTISTEEELMQNIVLADAITQISRQFPFYYTQVLYLHYIDGLPFRDIAAQMGISECAARQACHRMIKALRKYYREKE